jgi:hypothetical protein
LRCRERATPPKEVWHPAAAAHVFGKRSAGKTLCFEHEVHSLLRRGIIEIDTMIWLVRLNEHRQERESVILSWSRRVVFVKQAVDLTNRCTVFADSAQGTSNGERRSHANPLY